jgi:hypothetical protein
LAELVLPGTKCNHFVSRALVRRLFYFTFTSAQNKFFAAGAGLGEEQTCRSFVKMNRKLRGSFPSVVPQRDLAFLDPLFPV